MESHYDSRRQTNEEEEDLEMCPPVSPMSQSLNSSIVSLSIIIVLEFETTITESETLELIRNILLPLNKRFSSIMVTDKKGIKRWKKIDYFRVEDHLIVPTFPLGLDREENLREYLSKIGSERLSEEKPMWEAHLIKNNDPKTTVNYNIGRSNGGGGGSSSPSSSTLIFKLSHSLGDGYSFVGLIFKALKRVDHPSLPFTYPRMSLKKRSPQNDQEAGGIVKNLLGFFVKCKNTASDLTTNLLKSTVLEDKPSPIRSATTNKIDLFRPFSIYTVTLSLERVKQVKSKLGATVNDVLTGLISYMIHLYTSRITGGCRHHHHQVSSNNGGSMTIMVVVNLRMLKGYKNIEEMIKADTWGNHSHFMDVTIPSFTDLEEVNPLDFIIKAKEAMDRKKNSMFVYFIEAILKTTARIRGHKGLARMIHSGFKNSSTMITSVIGPKEQGALSGHPISDAYFIVTGIPQSLTFTSVSLMDQLKLVVTMEKDFIDSKLFTSCMDEAFENVFQAAFRNYEAQKSI
ncbi:O-acyltransferase [Macleaya cordata]|uniref:O-acyltransferase n=1 Tax=Macleaya cordata TaxID=56857 RepID=A0A200QZ94_MACCD|nr:O-acyltransferase [Macleaya cordata]